LTLPTQQLPIIPHHCAICDVAAPEHSFAYDIGVPVLILGYLAHWLPGRRFVSIPVCTRCRRASLLHSVVFFVFALISVGAAELTVCLNGNFFAANPMMVLPFVLVILGPAMAWSFWRLMRPAIGIHTHLFGVSYQFRGKRFFEEFCQLNAEFPAATSPAASAPAQSRTTAAS
jgi:hypothetical protein